MEGEEEKEEKVEGNEEKELWENEMQTSFCYGTARIFTKGRKWMQICIHFVAILKLELVHISFI